MNLFKIVLSFALAIILIQVNPNAIARTINLATDPWEPFYGPELKNEGYLFEITEEAFKRAGYNCKVSYLPWKRALELAKQGKYDGVLGIFYKKERTPFFYYSSPLSECRMVFWTKKENKINYTTLKDLMPYKIGYTYGYFYNYDFESAFFLKKIKVYKPVENLNLLLRDKVEVIIASEKVVYYLLRKEINSKGEIKPLYPPLAINKLYITISKSIENASEIIENFNKGLEVIKKDGTYEKILKKHKINVQ